MTDGQLLCWQYQSNPTKRHAGLSVAGWFPWCGGVLLLFLLWSLSSCGFSPLPALLKTKGELDGKDSLENGQTSCRSSILATKTRRGSGLKLQAWTRPGGEMILVVSNRAKLPLSNLSLELRAFHISVDLRTDRESQIRSRLELVSRETTLQPLNAAALFVPCFWPQQPLCSLSPPYSTEGFSPLLWGSALKAAGARFQWTLSTAECITAGAAPSPATHPVTFDPLPFALWVFIWPSGLSLLQYLCFRVFLSYASLSLPAPPLCCGLSTLSFFLCLYDRGFLFIRQDLNYAYHKKIEAQSTKKKWR